MFGMCRLYSVACVCVCYSRAILLHDCRWPLTATELTSSKSTTLTSEGRFSRSERARYIVVGVLSLSISERSTLRCLAAFKTTGLPDMLHWTFCSSSQACAVRKSEKAGNPRLNQNKIKYLQAT